MFLAGSGLPVDSHDGKALAHILNTYPRDELFQINEEELLATSLGILSLTQRKKVRLFLRFDRFDRFVSALVYVPRERYNHHHKSKNSRPSCTSTRRQNVKRDAVPRT